LTKVDCSGETAAVQSPAARYLYTMISNRVFLSAFFSWFLAQLIKMLVDQMRGRSRGSRDMVATLLWKTGGMPSSHSSLVTGLATAVAVVYGVQSPVFNISFFYGILIIRDAMGVRRSAGVQAQTLNALGRDLAQRTDIIFSPVKEVSGHTPAEVFVGVLLGFFTGLAFSLL
jgi:acid phosphatase family membrane protein YuiD